MRPIKSFLIWWDINKHIEYKNGDKIIFFGVNNGSLFIFVKD